MQELACYLTESESSLYANEWEVMRRAGNEIIPALTWYKYVKPRSSNDYNRQSSFKIPGLVCFLQSGHPVSHTNVMLKDVDCTIRG